MSTLRAQGGERERKARGEMRDDAAIGLREPKTIVVFRRWRTGDDSVIALFPEIEHNGHLCVSYAHIGQHGGASYQGCIAQTRPVPLTDPDVIALRRELESEPYNYRLVPRRRWTRTRA